MLKKFSRKILSTVLAVAMVGAMSTNVMASEVENGDYDYPIKPGSTEWAELDNHAQMIEACQIPDEILQTMSTDNLIETIMNYPLKIDMMAYDNLNDGFANVSSYFNGYQELAAREDASVKLLERYINTPVINKNQHTIDFKTVVDLTVLEANLSNDTYINKLTSDELSTFENVVAAKYSERLQNDRVYAASISPFYEKLNEEQNGFARDFTTTIKTPNGSNVAVTYVQSDYDSGAIQYYNAQFDNAYPQATRIANASKTYNCHSYAWYSQSPNNFWMGNPSAYVTDKSYAQTLNPAYGDKAVYGNYEHSALCVGTDGLSLLMRSKWGQMAAYQHKQDYGPYSVGVISFYR